MAGAEPLAAVRAFLLADADLAAIVGTRVFVGELPESEIEQMPRATVQLEPGGGMGNANQLYGDPRIDFYCYGDSPRVAWQVYRALHAALKDLQREVFAETLLHWARESAMGALGRDPEKDWPVTLNSWQVRAAEIAAT